MTEEPPQQQRRWVKPLVLALVIAVSVFVLFTWVFPWITELGLSPAMD